MDCRERGSHASGVYVTQDTIPRAWELETKYQSLNIKKLKSYFSLLLQIVGFKCQIQVCYNQWYQLNNNTGIIVI